MSGSRASAVLGAGLAVALCAGGCTTPRDPAPAELSPLVVAEGPRAVLADRYDRMAARTAELAFADRPDAAATLLEPLAERDRERRAAGLPETGLADNAAALVAAARGDETYIAFAEAVLADDAADPHLRRQLERELATRPLAVAEQRLAEHRRAELAHVVNSVTAPLSRLATGGVLQPIETGRAALAALLVTHSLPPISIQERQALRAYEDFLDRHPDDPRADEVSRDVHHYRAKLQAAREEEVLEVAEKSLDSGHPGAALVHLGRAGRMEAPDDQARELGERAVDDLEQREALLELSLQADPRPLPAPEHHAALLVAVIAGPLQPVGDWAQEHAAANPDAALADEFGFTAALALRAGGNEDGFFDAMDALADADPAKSNMARHASRVVHDGEQNPYALYERARSADRSARLRWVALGRRSRGAIKRDLWRPLEYLLDIPGFATSIIMTPIRVAQYPDARHRFGAPVLDSGERYLDHFPEGIHASDVHVELEELYAGRSQWNRALEHHEAGPNPDVGTVSDYREHIAENMLHAAELHPRVDVRASLYRAVARDYDDLPQGAEARRQLQALLEDATPQAIRISREFLVEYPDLRAPGALGLRPELFDGEEENGELAEDGVFLIGQNYVSVALVDQEPSIQAVPPDDFALFISLLEERSYERLLEDGRERAEPDLQRDLFFERARLGLLDEPDMRPTATSSAEFLSTHEKHGYVRTRESILPVELVVQGGLEDFGLAAFPRVTKPRPTYDAFLYR